MASRNLIELTLRMENEVRKARLEFETNIDPACVQARKQHETQYLIQRTKQLIQELGDEEITVTKNDLPQPEPLLQEEEYAQKNMGILFTLSVIIDQEKGEVEYDQEINDIIKEITDLFASNTNSPATGLLKTSFNFNKE